MKNQETSTTNTRQPILNIERLIEKVEITVHCNGCNKPLTKDCDTVLTQIRQALSEELLQWSQNFLQSLAKSLQQNEYPQTSSH